MWRKGLPVSILPDGNERTQVILIGKSTVCINTYLPCRGSYTLEEYKDEVDQINEICLKYKHFNIYLTGDMNVDVHRQDDGRVLYFQDFMRRHKLREVIIIKEPTYNHHKRDEAATKIDYILTNRDMSKGEAIYKILSPVSYNTSPHKALMLQVKHEEIVIDEIKKEEPKKIILWHKADIDLYQEVLKGYLEDSGEITCINSAIEYLTHAIQKATEAAVPMKTLKPNYKPPPWNEEIKLLLETSKEADAKWKRIGCPNYGLLFEERREVRKKLRSAQRIQSALIRDRKHDNLMCAHSSDKQTFYRLIREQRKTTSIEITELEVNGITYKGDLLPAWTNHFKSLAEPLQDPNFDDEYDRLVKEDLCNIETICRNIIADHIPITVLEIQEAISHLKTKKAKDETGLVSEHLKMGGYHLEKYITCIVDHIVRTKDIPCLLKSGILHSLHKKGKPIEKAGNYRGITIIKIIAKIFDIILTLHHETAAPDTHDMQFSFTKGRAPSHATFLMTELIAEAQDTKKPLYILNMDIQKASLSIEEAIPRRCYSKMVVAEEVFL